MQCCTLQLKQVKYALTADMLMSHQPQQSLLVLSSILSQLLSQELFISPGIYILLFQFIIILYKNIKLSNFDFYRKCCCHTLLYKTELKYQKLVLIAPWLYPPPL